MSTADRKRAAKRIRLKYGRKGAKQKEIKTVLPGKKG